MKEYKESFIEFMVECGALRFGDFVTKSGRKTPFFINTGQFNTGGTLEKLGRYYASAIAQDLSLDFDVLFGPAYKGIPLSVSCAMALNSMYGTDVRFSSSRKEIKDHGDKGIWLGSPIKDNDRVLIIEDVTTAGTSIRESLPLISSAGEGVKVAGLIVSVDRMERGTSEKSALREIEDTYGFKASAIVTMEEVIGYLTGRQVGGRTIIDRETKARIDEYYSIYGAK